MFLEIIVVVERKYISWKYDWKYWCFSVMFCVIVLLIILFYKVCWLKYFVSLLFYLCSNFLILLLVFFVMDRMLFLFWKKYFLSERKFFFCVCFLCLKCRLLFLFVIWFCVFWFVGFILGLLVLFYVFGDLFILLFDWLKLFCVDVMEFVCRGNLN